MSQHFRASLAGLGVLVLLFGSAALASGSSPVALLGKTSSLELRTPGEVPRPVGVTPLPAPESRTVCGLTYCGYVTHYGEVGYEVFMLDFVNAWNNQTPAPADTIANLTWQLLGNVDEPSSCGGSVIQCAYLHYVTGCDEDATFFVYYYDASWSYITDYEFTANEIAYSYPC